MTAPTISSITYDIAAATATTPATTLSEFGLANSTGSQPVVQLPVTPVNPGGIVPGTLSGVLVVDGFPRNFQMYSLFPLVGEGSRLLFYNDGTPSLNGLVTINRDTANPKVVNVVGTVDYDRGTIALRFTDGEGGPAINPGAVSVSFVDYAVYNQDAKASSFTFAPGQTFEQKSYVDLLTPGSTIAINSRIAQTTPPKGNGELSPRHKYQLQRRSSGRGFPRYWFNRSHASEQVGQACHCLWRDCHRDRQHQSRCVGDLCGCRLRRTGL